jgi:hypothetical protein
LLNVRHGYGIFRWASGSVYYGQWKENNRDGYGYFKEANGSEYYGPWKNHTRWGDAVVNVDGQYYTRKYEEDKIISSTKMNG